VIWFGATKDKVLYEVEDLVRVAQLYGLRLDQEMQTKLYGEKDERQK
jgi:hypothetical protein